MRRDIDDRARRNLLALQDQRAMAVAPPVPPDSPARPPRAEASAAPAAGPALRFRLRVEARAPAPLAPQRRAGRGRAGTGAEQVASRARTGAQQGAPLALARAGSAAVPDRVDAEWRVAAGRPRVERVRGEGELAATPAGPVGSGPVVDRTNPQLYQFSFGANTVDSKASLALGKQFAYLDTRVAPKAKLVIYLHGADDFANCGNGALGTLVASWGFHWFAPCYAANYGVDNCGNDIEGCRLEALDGTDHHPFVKIGRSDSIEERVVLGLKQLQT